MARTLPSNFCQTVFMWSSCIATRFFTKSAASAPTEALSISILTRTPPTGMPKSWNHWMKRVMTAMGSASGSVTKKNDVFSGSVRRTRPCSIRSRKEMRYAMSGSSSFFFVNESISRRVFASSRLLSILLTQSP